MNSFISNSFDFITQKSKSILGSDNLGNNPDYMLLEQQKEKLSIGIKEVQNLIERAYIKPFQSPAKIFVIKQADLMTEEAQNALLKVLEEPPETTYFFLYTEKLTDLLITIRSRCDINFFDLSYKSEINVPDLENILKTPLAQRFSIAEGLFADNTVMPKILLDEFLDKNIYETEKYQYSPDISKVLDIALEAKKLINSNASPKNVLDLYFLKLPLWQ